MVCHNCERRKPGCHAKCVDYAAFVETLSQRKRGPDQTYEDYLLRTKTRIIEEMRKRKLK
jgi:hypothetical protein